VFALRDLGGSGLGSGNYASGAGETERSMDCVCVGV
jgi:hypothetical protein